MKTIARRGATLWWNALSPDGSRIAYTTFSPRVSLRTVPVAGGLPRVVVVHAARAELDQPIWRTDGRRIAYSNDFVGGEIATVASTGGRPDVLVPADGSIRYVVAYPADGRVIVEERDREGTGGRVFSVRGDGTQKVLARNAFFAAASADGSTIAYSSRRGEVYVVSARGGEPRRLRIGGLAPFTVRAAFSPGGCRLAVVGSDLAGRRLGYIARVDGSGVARLPYHFAGLGWSRDGSRLAVDGWKRTPKRSFLATVDGSGGSLRVLVRARCMGEVFSPDGRRIACGDFDLDRKIQSGTTDLAVLTFSG
jgi:Tol biopolymer transport system component